MVAAVGLLVGYTGVGALSVAGVTLATAGQLTVAGIALNIGASLALSALTQPQVPEAAKPENLQVTTKLAAAPRTAHVGIVKVAGNTVFHRARNGVSYRVIVHGHGEITEVLSRYLDNTLVPFDAAGDVVTTHRPYVVKNNTEAGPIYQSRVHVESRRGLVPSAHYDAITQIWPEWTSDHRLDGLWTSMIRAQSVSVSKQPKVFPNGEPQLSVLAKTARFFDPRTGETAFTENAALIIAGYVALADGFNRPAVFDNQEIAEQADICDRDTLLATGGTEKLYRLSGSYLLNEKPQNVLGRMLQACAGRIRLKPSGKVGLKVGAWTEPKFTLSYGDILEVQEVNSGPDLLDRYNELPARFNSHDLGHIEVDAEPWRDLTRVAEDGEILTGPDKSLLMCPSHRQARQAMKIHMERDNPKQQVTLLCKPKALPAIYEDTIALNVPQMALVGNYEVAQHVVSFEKGLLKAVSLTLRKVDLLAFSLGLDDQGSVQNPPEPDTPAGVPLPQNVTAAAAGIQTSSSTFAAGIAVGWQAPPSDALSPVLRVRSGGEGAWRDVPTGPDATSAVISGLIDGQSYDVSLSFVTAGGVEGEAVILTDLVAAAATDPPAPPTNLAVSDASGGTALVEMTASVSPSLWKTEIYRDSALVGVVYAGPGSKIAFVDNCGAGTFDWTARSVNVSSLNSTSDAGPVSATIA